MKTMKLSEAKQRLREEGYRLHKLNERCGWSYGPCGGPSTSTSSVKVHKTSKPRKPSAEEVNEPAMKKILKNKLKKIRDVGYIWRQGKHYYVNIGIGGVVTLVYVVKNPKELSAEYKGMKIDGRFFARKEDVIDKLKENIDEFENKWHKYQGKTKYYQYLVKEIDSIDYSIAE